MSSNAPITLSGGRGMSADKLSKHRARKRTNIIALTLSMLAMGFGLFWLAWILFETVRLGIGGLTLAVFTEMTPPPQAETGGLANALFGSAMMPPSSHNPAPRPMRSSRPPHRKRPGSAGSPQGPARTSRPGR